MNNLLTRLRAPLTMSMFRNASDLAAEALIQRREAREEIERLRTALEDTTGLLQAWCAAIDEHGSAWDDWDEYYKAACYEPSIHSPNRGVIARALAALASHPASPAQGDRLAGERQRVNEHNLSLQQGGGDHHG